MTQAFSTTVKFDLLKVGYCQHPECAALRGAGRRAIDFPALVGLIEHPQLGLILYDTGYSDHFLEATRRFPECLYRMISPMILPPQEQLLVQLESRGIAATDIQTIIISHFHADHVAGLKDFPNARFIATRSERDCCEKQGRLGRLRRAYLRHLLPDDLQKRLTYAESKAVVSLPSQWMPFEQGFDLFDDASLLGVNLPGHTASQLGLVFEAQDIGNIFLVADACWKIEGLEQNRRPARFAYTLFDSRRAYDATFEKLYTLHRSKHALRIIPSHCSTTWDAIGGSRRITFS
jgi:glyoxylase-like metal-dependent hydrolase (beta-lactamase superfamily II)